MVQAPPEQVQRQPRGPEVGIIAPRKNTGPDDPTMTAVILSQTR
jgi:hypothetical protein